MQTTNYCLRTENSLEFRPHPLAKDKLDRLVKVLTGVAQDRLDEHNTRLGKTASKISSVAAEKIGNDLYLIGVSEFKVYDFKIEPNHKHYEDLKTVLWIDVKEQELPSTASSGSTPTNPNSEVESDSDSEVESDSDSEFELNPDLDETVSPKNVVIEIPDPDPEVTPNPGTNSNTSNLITHNTQLESSAVPKSNPTTEMINETVSLENIVLEILAFPADPQYKPTHTINSSSQGIPTSSLDDTNATEDPIEARKKIESAEKGPIRAPLRPKIPNSAYLNRRKAYQERFEQSCREEKPSSNTNLKHSSKTFNEIPGPIFKKSKKRNSSWLAHADVSKTTLHPSAAITPYNLEQSASSQSQGKRAGELDNIPTKHLTRSQSMSDRRAQSTTKVEPKTIPTAWRSETDPETTQLPPPRITRRTSSPDLLGSYPLPKAKEPPKRFCAKVNGFLRDTVDPETLWIRVNKLIQSFPGKLLSPLFPSFMLDQDPESQP